VLGALLDAVLVSATAKLRSMSKGRYQLLRTDERRGSRRAAGLDMDVYDAWTGKSRPVSTLSGGESFLAALSLALGLAETVQACTGGIYLDTIFVDEGFGTLDDEALDLAIDTLMQLQEGDRLVGIISHVAELKERVDARLEVTAERGVSRARFVVP
jgi:exonuclease SbcC